MDQPPEQRRRAAQIVRALKREYPNARCALDFANPLQLLVATMLSAQCTDARVNAVTPGLFRKYRSARDFANASQAELEQAIRSTGFFRNKAKNIRACCRRLADAFAGEVPRDTVAMVQLPGVGRKTANVVLGTAFGIASGVVVDTHVGRISRRLGLTSETNPAKIEMDLMRILPRKEWIDFSHRLIHHGRLVCTARKPRCEDCTLLVYCPRIGVAAGPATARSRPAPRKRRDLSPRIRSPQREHGER